MFTLSIVKFPAPTLITSIPITSFVTSRVTFSKRPVLTVAVASINDTVGAFDLIITTSGPAPIIST